MHVQESVLPLEVYNDVQHTAAPALAAHHLVAEAEADAEVCLRKLITNLATEVRVPRARALGHHAAGSVALLYALQRNKRADSRCLLHL